MTTNAGSKGSSTLPGFTDSPDIKSAEKTEKALSEFLRPEFINRVDEIVTFRSLSKENFKNIADIMLSDLVKTMAEKEIVMTYTTAAAELVAEKSFSVKYGARNMRRYIETAVEDKIAAEIIRTRGALKAMNIDAENGEITVISM